VAARAIARHASRFPDLIPVELETSHLEDRDAALAHAITDAVLRHWLLLEDLLNSVLTRPLREAPARTVAVLLTGAAQLLLLERIPVHAAINESVELAKSEGRGTAGMVNAVLRKVAAMRAEARPAPEVVELADVPRDRAPLPDGSWLSLSGELLPPDERARLAVATSHPLGLIRRWADRAATSSALRIVDLALHSLAIPPVVVNTAFAREPLPAMLTPHSRAGHHVFIGSRAELVELLRRDNLWVQDPASSRAVAAAAHLEPEVVLDLCAGQGTKTRQLAATFPRARVIATDVDRARFATLERVFGGGRGNGRVEVVGPTQVRDRYIGKADLILLDVPCSNTGVLPRRVEAKYRCGPEQMARLVDLQRQIMADAIPLLRESPRGRILYSTCSIEPDENNLQVAWAAKWHRFRVEKQELLLPAGRPGGLAAEYHDGSFFTLMA
jgi:16S rRNA (cytosine967-C5)-methyltransferase